MRKLLMPILAALRPPRSPPAWRWAASPYERCAFRASRLHDREHVAHASLELGDPGRPIRRADPALVEDDQPREGGKAPVESLHERKPP
jgi:hypothetical protein